MVLRILVLTNASGKPDGTSMVSILTPRLCRSRCTRTRAALLTVDWRRARFIVRRLCAPLYPKGHRTYPMV